MQKDHGLPMATDDGVKWLQQAFFEGASQLSLMPGCAELVHAVQDTGGIKLAVASSSPMPLIQRVLTPTGLIKRFDLLCSGTNVPHPKPAPDVFLHTASQLEVAPERCVVLEDSVAGAEAGARAGMTVFAVAALPPADFAPWASEVFTDLHGVATKLGFRTQSQ
jgi:HAD superfamily hydrolase (TIGR01509 family)